MGVGVGGGGGLVVVVVVVGWWWWWWWVGGGGGGEPNGQYIVNDTSKCIFLKENFCILIKISSMFFSSGCNSQTSHHWLS